MERTLKDKTNRPEFKEKFVEEYTEGFGEDWVSKFIDVCNHHPAKAIRVNTAKISVDELKDQLHDEWMLESIPWCDEGFWIHHEEGDRFDVGNLYSHLMGDIYVQSAASMIPPVVLDVKPGHHVLDMCAAPGSKTTQIAQYLEGDGFVVANDSNGNRLTALGINQQRLGLPEIIVTNMEGQRLPEQQKYDRVLVDAPCTGTGTIMKSHRAAEMWSDSFVAKMVGIQDVLIRKAWELLRPGGILVYSTCSVQPEENEGVVSRFVEDTGAVPIPIDIPVVRSDVVREWKEEEYSNVEEVLRISPQDNWTEGFFVSKFRKEG